MSHQSGAAKLKKADKKSLKLLELDRLDADFREARAWRERIRGPNIHIRDCNKDDILIHFDEALHAANGYRRKLMEKETDCE